MTLSSDARWPRRRRSAYAIQASDAAGSGLSNYTISYADGTLTVSKATLTITANDATRPTARPCPR